MAAQEKLPKFNKRSFDKYSRLIQKKEQEIEAIKQEILYFVAKRNRQVGFCEFDQEIGKGKNKKTIKAGYKSFTEDFVDEDTGEVVSIVRKELCEFDGKPTDRIGRELTYENYKQHERYS